MTQTDHPAPPLAEPVDAAQWLREHKVTVAAVTMIIAQLWWKAVLLGHAYLRQDDFRFLDHGLFSGLSWNYLTSVNAGHLMPIGRGLAWLTSRIELYDWPLAAGTILVLVAAASLAMWRMLHVLFGSRPLILIPLGVYLFSPLSLAGADWWAVSLEVLPLELAMFMAVTAHVRYLRTGRLRYAAASGGWQVVAMGSMEKGAVVSLLIFGLTSAYLAPEARGRWPAAMLAVARRYWRAWAIYGGILAAYCVLLVIEMATATTPPAMPSSAGRVLDLAVTMVGSSLLTGVFGGPWQWWVAGLGFAQTSPPAVLAQVSWALALLVVVASCLFRRHAWRVWLIALGWIAAADILPVAAGRLQQYPASLLGVQARYVTDATGVLALCVAIAFLPVAGEEGAYRMRAPGLRLPLRAGIVALACAFLAGSLWSSVSLEASLVGPAGSARSYIATAQAAVSGAPHNVLIVDTATPAYVLDPGLFWNLGYTSNVIGAVAHAQARDDLRWAAAPRGAYDGPLMIFNPSGQLLPAVLEGPSAARGPRCLPENVPVSGSLYAWAWEVRLRYSGPAATIWVRYGRGRWSSAHVPSGAHTVYVPIIGSGNTVTVVPVPGNGCVTSLTVGSLHPGPAAYAVPAAVVPG